MPSVSNAGRNSGGALGGWEEREKWEVRWREQENKIRGLEMKLSQKKLKEEQEMKYAEERISQLEKTNGNLEMIISEKDDRIHHHKSQIY